MGICVALFGHVFQQEGVHCIQEIRSGGTLAHGQEQDRTPCGLGAFLRTQCAKQVDNQLCTIDPCCTAPTAMKDMLLASTLAKCISDSQHHCYHHEMSGRH